MRHGPTASDVQEVVAHAVDVRDDFRVVVAHARQRAGELDDAVACVSDGSPRRRRVDVDLRVKGTGRRRNAQWPFVIHRAMSRAAQALYGPTTGWTKYPRGPGHILSVAAYLT